MKVALVGNPNTGKSSLFNRLTGLNQKIGNYPGVTVDKKIGSFKTSENTTITVVDLPGTYSLNASSKDEEIVTEALTNNEFDDYPETVVVVADATNLKRNLFLFTQVLDLELPTILVLNMIDVAEKRGIHIDTEGLRTELGVPVVEVNSRKGAGISELKALLNGEVKSSDVHVFEPTEEFGTFVQEAQEYLKTNNSYSSWLVAVATDYDSIKKEKKEHLAALRKSHSIIPKRALVKETIARYRYIDELLEKFVSKDRGAFGGYTQRLDNLFTHRIWGFVIFLGLLTLIFQAIYSWSTLPMDLIETLFATMSAWAMENLPPGPLVELIADGIIPGLAGVLVFIPQIAILFAFIALLEETGYMSRVVFIMDKVMRQFGMNGRSVVPLLSGMACAIPAVMATRSINNWKERLITIMVTPFMTCSARLPVYTILIALAVPSTTVLGFMNLQGLVLMAMYIFGFVMAILAAWVFDKVLNAKHKGYLMMEMPPYKMPQGRNVGMTILEKVKSFVFTAGKIIMAISVILWVLARYGPTERKELAAEQIQEQAQVEHWSDREVEAKIASSDLENSYIGIFGRAIEPAIAPLGYDWKIGIALISSFAAREVFVGTMATIYAVADPENERGIKERMAADVNSTTGKSTFTFAVAISLLIFYALAMQCMSTMAVVYRETKGWKWPLIQFAFMTGTAYVLSLIAYQLLK